MNGRAAGAHADGWRAAVPEICIAAAVAAVAAFGAYAAAGLAGAALAVICAAVAALVVVWFLAPRWDGKAAAADLPAETEAIPATARPSAASSQAGSGSRQSGIPPRTLARLIDRLEQL
jgi:hypothetical protein